MGKKIMSLITVLCIVLGMAIPVAAAPEEFATRVSYYRYTTAGQVITYATYATDLISDMNVPLFQINKDNQGQRSDGYIYSCETVIDLTGMTDKYGVEIRYGNPVTYNMETQTLSGAYNKLAITVIYADGTEQVYYTNTGSVDDLGNVKYIQVGDLGTVEFSDEICLTMLRKVAVDQVRINIGLYADDVGDIIPKPMSWWADGTITFSEISYLEQKVDDIIANQSVVIQQMNVITNPDSGDLDKIGVFENDVSDRQEQSNQLVEDIKVNKPTISDDVLNPMDKVDSEALNTMGGVLGAVFASPTLGSIAVMTLVFALIGYILYGKR